VLLQRGRVHWGSVTVLIAVCPKSARHDIPALSRLKTIHLCYATSNKHRYAIRIAIDNGEEAVMGRLKNEP
jgi:hypothetical protein